MAEFATLGDALKRHAATVPERIALIVPSDDQAKDVPFTYAELHKLACGVARRLAKLDLGGKRVLICPPAGAQFVAGLFGCFYAGSVSVPTFPPGSGRSRADARLQSIVADCTPEAALTDSIHARRGLVLSQRQPGLERLRWIDINETDMEEIDIDSRADCEDECSLSSARESQSLALSTHPARLLNLRG